MFQTFPGEAREAQNLIKQMKNHPRNLSGKKDGKRKAKDSRPLQNKLYQSFNRKKKNSFYYCNKDVYLMKLNIFSNNFFNILTKISGPKKNIFIFANYYRII